MSLLALFFAALIGVAHHFSDFFYKYFYHGRGIVASFTAGVSVAYLFLTLLPISIEKANSYLYFGLLFGFVIVHLAEKYIVQEKPRRKVFLKEEIHAIIFFLYYFVFGASLAAVMELNIFNGLFLFLPVFIHTLTSSAPLEEMSPKARGIHPVKVLLTTAAFIGVVFYSVLSLPALAVNLLPFLVGAILYVIIRDEIPLGTAGKPKYFLLGAVLYTIMIYAIQTLL